MCLVNEATIVRCHEHLMDEQLQCVGNCVTCLASNLASFYDQRQSQANYVRSQLMMRERGYMRQPGRWRITVGNLAMSEQIKIPYNQSRMERRGRMFPIFILSE